MQSPTIKPPVRDSNNPEYQRRRARDLAVRNRVTITRIMRDEALFGKWFKADCWNNWMIFQNALFGLPLSVKELSVFSKHTGRDLPASSPAREAWLVVGRRGGKSLISALIAVYLSCFKDYSKYLAPGERASVMVIAADRRQARVVMRYIAGFFDEIPMLSVMIESRTKESLTLANRVSLEVHTCSFRTVRGYTLAAAICDEIAFWRSEESANPDFEIINALRPGLATIPESMLLCLSSPYARRGALWEAYQKHFGKEGDPILVWQANTLSMNPTISEEIIKQSYEDDESRARAEYGAQFRSDVESFVSRESLDACRVPDRIELPYSRQFRYLGFVDPSGGQADSMTLGIAHREDACSVLDLVREVKPPFSPEQVTTDFAAMLKAYRISSVTGDRYGGFWPRERFRLCGIEYKTSTLTKSEIYRSFLPEINSGKVELLDNPRLFNQLLQLERRTGAGGRETIDHAPGAHDDLANAAAGALLLAGGFAGPSGGQKPLIGL